MFKSIINLMNANENDYLVIELLFVDRIKEEISLKFRIINLLFCFYRQMILMGKRVVLLKILLSIFLRNLIISLSSREYFLSNKIVSVFSL